MDLAPWDYNGDGSVSLAVAAYNYHPTQPEVSPSRVFILEKDLLGNIYVAWQGNPPLGGHDPGYFTLQWADVDCNGYDDLIAGSVCLADEDAYLLVYMNINGTLNTTPDVVSLDSSVDITDLVWGDFISEYEDESIPDLLILSHGNNPQVIVGTETAGGWTLMPGMFPQTPEEWVDLEHHPTSNAEPWCALNGAVREMILFTSSPPIRLRIDQHGYSELKEKMDGGWLSIGLSPPSAGNLTYGCNIISGNAWKAGVAYWFSQADSGWDVDILLEPEGDEYFVEFVSDIATIVSHYWGDPRCFAGLSEAGQLMSEDPDPRNRHGRIMEIDLDASGHWESVSAFWTEPDLLSGGEHSEAFSVAWCPFSNTTTMDVDYTGPETIFRMSEGNSSLTGFEPVYGINSAIITKPGSFPRQADVWYCGNGWFGMTEPLGTGETLEMELLTADRPEIVFGRRGCIESWSIL
jgi:hypothetical protein